MKKIIAIGANVYDTLICVNEYPKEDTKLRAEKIIKCGGGPAATGIVCAAKLGADCSFMGNITDDEGGLFLWNDFKKYNVKRDKCNTVKGFSSFSSVVLLSNSTKTRTCVFDKGNVPALKLDDLQKQAILDSDLLMVDGNELSGAVEAAKLARQNNADVLYDAGGLYENVEELLAVSNILIPSYEFATGFTKTDNAEDAAKELFIKFSPDVVVITDGKKGGYMYDGKEFWHYHSFPVNAVDTNGAGDVFHGAFAYAITHGYDYKSACIFSSAVSAIKCTRLGARAGIPAIDEVIKFLGERGYNEFKENME